MSEETESSGVDPIEERKTKAESVIMSKLQYCLESTSTGRKKDLATLQGMQSQAARWVLGKRRLGWSLTAGLKKLSWLSMAQLVCYKSVQTALKVLQRKEPENLYERLTKLKIVNRKRKAGEDVQEERVIIKRSWEELVKMKASSRRAWSVRSLRWLERIPAGIKELDVAGEASKKELKMWVRRHIHVRGDRILWGRPIEREHDSSLRENEERDLDDEEREGGDTRRELPDRGGTHEEEAIGGPHGDEALGGPREVEVVAATEEYRVARRSCRPLPSLGPVPQAVVWTALQHGEVTGLSQEQNTTGEDGGIIKKKDMTDSSCCMSGAERAGLTRCTEIERPVFPVQMWQGGTAAARSRKGAEKENKVVAAGPSLP